MDLISPILGISFFQIFMGGNDKTVKSLSINFSNALDASASFNFVGETMMDLHFLMMVFLSVSSFIR